MKHTLLAVKELRRMFPEIQGISTAAAFNGNEGAIFLGDCAEGGTVDGISACDYYAEDPYEKVYILGVHKKLRSALSSLGFYPECHDPGTWLAYKL